MKFLDTADITRDMSNMCIASSVLNTFFLRHVKLCVVRRGQSPLFIVAGFRERPSGNNPESLYSGLRVLQVAQATQTKLGENKSQNLKDVKFTKKIKLF